MALVSQGELFTRRTERLHCFFEEVRRYLFNRCIDSNTSVVAVDVFSHELFIHFCKQPEHDFMSLLMLLTSDDFLEETFSRYQNIL